MKSVHVVVSSTNAAVAARLADSLKSHLPAVAVGHNLQETRAAIARHRASGIIIDLETCNFETVKQLCHEFPGTNVVCTHRLADEQMWVAALNAGAVDCCSDADVSSMLKAVGYTAPATRQAAA